MVIKTLGLYECVFILKPEITKENLDLFLQNCQQEIVKDQGKVEGIEHWGVRNLAYHIKKVNRGNYVMLKINVSNSLLVNLRDFVKFHNLVLRYVIFRVDKFDTEPSELASIHHDHNKYDHNKSNSHYHRRSYTNTRSDNAKTFSSKTINADQDFNNNIISANNDQNSSMTKNDITTNK